jgi:hypothetical protein
MFITKSNAEIITTNEIEIIKNKRNKLTGQPRNNLQHYWNAFMSEA